MTPLMRLVSLVTLPIAFLISMTHLVGAESGPGDGFTAGIITALGLTLEYLAFGYRQIHRRYRWLRFEVGLAMGITLAVLAAVLPLLAGQPLLAMPEVAFHLPLLDTITIKTALLFDLGIYFAVLGGAMTAIDHLREEIP